MGTSGFNLAAERDEAKLEDLGIVVHVHQRNGKPCFYTKDGQDVAVTIRVAGTYSERHRKAFNRNRKIMLEARRNRIADQIDGQQVDLVASCILSWEGLTLDGQDFPFTNENAIALLTDCPWVREQLEEAMRDHAGFSKSNSGT